MIQISDTTEQFDLEKLKRHDKMHFYCDIPLFEDELADHGSAILSVKMVRYVMWYCLDT